MPTTVLSRPTGPTTRASTMASSPTAIPVTTCPMLNRRAAVRGSTSPDAPSLTDESVDIVFLTRLAIEGPVDELIIVEPRRAQGPVDELIIVEPRRAQGAAEHVGFAA